MAGEKRRNLYPTVVFVAMLSILFCAVDVGAQSQLPVTGQYPGGHVGIRGGGNPPPNMKTVATFLRFQDTYAVKDDSGNTSESVDDSYFANIWAIVWSTDWKFLGGRYGGLVAIPFSDSVARPNGGEQDSGFGLTDIVALPVLVLYDWKEFDFQWGAGVIVPSGEFTPGEPSRGAGYWGILGSVGGVWYPGGDRRSWSVSAVARLEFNGKQEDTDIHVGDDVVIDWGVGKMFMVGKKSFPVVLDVGISGFAEWQVTSQSGPSPEDSTPKYRVFAIGPELQWAIPKYKISGLFRYQPQFGARNTTQANNFWFNISYHW